MMEKLKKREKIAYGLGDLGNNIAYGAMGFYLVYFLTDVAGLSALWAGYIFMIVRMWNAVFDLIIGVLSDQTKTRFGRRRPYLLIGAIPLSISFALLWQLFFKEMNSMIIYYTIVGIFFSTMYSFVAIPYNSLLPEMSQDYDERTSISGYKMAFSFVGSLLSAVGVTLIVDTIYPGKSMYSISYPMMGFVLGIAITVTILLAFFGTKERVEPKGKEKQEKFFKNLLSLFQLKEYRLVLGVFIGNMVGFDIIMALYMYFMKYALQISSDISFIFMGIPLVCAVIVTPFWVSMSNKIGKQKTYIISAIYFIIPLILCIFLPANNLLFTVIVVIMIGAGISASQVLTFSILPDIVEVDELKNGIRREGIIYGVTMFLYKIGSAIIVAMVTASMGLFGYIESAGDSMINQPVSAILGIRLLISFVPAFFFIISALFVQRLPLGKEDFDKMKKNVADRI